MIGAIFATDEFGGFGYDNKLPWHNSADLENFKKITFGGKIVMGRATFESLPGKLPRRKHIVITSDDDYYHMGSDWNYRSVESLLENENNFWVIGGAHLLPQMAQHYAVVYHTVIYGKYNCDTYLDASKVIGNMYHLKTIKLDGCEVRVYIDENKF